jgi:hypothetical protein
MQDKKPRKPEPPGASTERSRKHRALNHQPPEVRGIRAPAEHYTAIRQAARDKARELQSTDGKD